MCGPDSVSRSHTMLRVAFLLFVSVIYTAPTVIFLIFAAMAAEGYFAPQERFMYVY